AIVLDPDAILQPGLDDPGIAIGRPWIARALVAGGHVADSNQAFARWLGRGRPAFVPRLGAMPEEVVARIHAAGGLDALEAYHSNHDPTATAHYLSEAARLGLVVTGGSDYHADETHGADGPGSVSLPREAYAKLVRLKADTTT